MNRGLDREKSDLAGILATLKPPILIVSTVAGKGIYSIAEALRERIIHAGEVHHVILEDLLPRNALIQDYKRYNFISNKMPVLLNLVYRIPFFYYRKLFRETYFRRSDMFLIREKIDSLGIQTVICASHRPAFWFSNFKSHEKRKFALWGMLSEYGRNLGWKYIFWDAVDGYLSPVAKAAFDFPFPEGMQFFEVDLPCQKKYSLLHAQEPDRNRVLFVAGHWGQISFSRAVSLLKHLFKENTSLQVDLVCGTNEKLRLMLTAAFAHDPRAHIYGDTGSLYELMGRSASIITKPGISTILEARAAGRKIFLLKGMPVAEDNNARYAIKNFGADWFSCRAFKEWYGKVV